MQTSDLKIVNYPHPALRVKCQPVTNIDKDLRLTAGKMLDLMHEREGLGLAAPQVALDAQMIVMQFLGTEEEPGPIVVAVNPVIVSTKGKLKDREGCLSFPGLYQDILRAKTVKVKYYDLDGKLQEATATDIDARLWQHEIDHLNGVLFIDKMGPLARYGSRNDIAKYIQDFEEDLKDGKLPPGLEAKL
ncbi:peptide deformylase [soil metagenome]